MSECTSCSAGVTANLSEPVEGTCPAVGYQKVAVCVPVLITPFAHTGKTVTKCCGEPAVVPGEMPCPGRKNGVCAFIMSLTICVEVPVNFGATAVVGDTFVDCIDASAEDICRNCKEEV